MKDRRDAAAEARRPFMSVLIPLLLVLGLPWCAHAADAESTKSRSEEVVVSGKPADPDQVRKALVEAEDRFYSRYNELNRDDDYDVQCRVEAPLGQRLKQRSCEPRFVVEAARDNTTANANTSGAGSGSYVGRGTQVNARLGPKMEEFRRRMQQFASQDPALQSALVERVRLEQEYKALLRK